MILAASLLVGCGGGGGGSSSSAQSPTAAPATVLGKATISWTAPVANSDGSALTNLTGYKIYYGMNQNDLDSVQSISNSSVTTFIVENLTSGTWFFAVSAVNGQGYESTLSNIASKTI